MIMAGVAMPFLPIETEILEQAIAGMFVLKDPVITEANRRAFQSGKDTDGDSAQRPIPPAVSA
jgi:hypothetical protein